MFKRRYSLISFDQSKQIESTLSYLTANYRFQMEAAEAQISVIKSERDSLLQALLQFRPSFWLVAVAARKLPFTWLRLYLAKKYWRGRQDLYVEASAACQDYRMAKKLAPARRFIRYALAASRLNRSSSRGRGNGVKSKEETNTTVKDNNEAEEVWDNLPLLLEDMHRLSPKIKPLKVTW